MFNHETHHRGQITTVLTQLGLGFGATDIPFMPKFQK
nr:DinB family protein [Roseobacter cerasinus]